MSELVLTNARIVLRDEVVTGSLCVIDGRIAAIDRSPVIARGAIDCEGDDLLPGLVELHTDVLEKHACPRPGVRWPGIAAVAAHDGQLATAGITTVLNGLAVGYLIDTGQRTFDPRPLAAAVYAAQAAGLLRLEHFLHLRCEVSVEGVLEMFEPFVGDPMVRLVSLMDHTPGQRQFTSVETYRQYYQGRYALSDAQIDAMIERRTRDREQYRVAHRTAITRACQAHGVPLASHDDATVAHVEEAAKVGSVIAEFPTTVEAARAARAYGLAILVGAPNLVLGRSHSGNVSAAELVTSGLADIVSSDYVPSGALQAVYELHRRHAWTLPAAVAATSRIPASRVGLGDRGEIAPGRRADLVRVRAAEVPIVRGVWVRGQRVA